MVEETKRCRGTRRDDTPCQAPAHTIGPDGYCWAHDPAKREARRAARAKGGQNKATAIRVASAPLPSYLRPVLALVVRALVDVRDGRLSPAQGSALAALAGVAIKLVTAAQFEEHRNDERGNARGAPGTGAVRRGVPPIPPVVPRPPPGD
jgi:hypothetical protein